MAHTKLLKKINDVIDTYDFHYEVCKEWTALRAVVELHKPQVSPFDDSQCSECSSEELSVIYPCKTIIAIEKNLT